MTGYYKISNSKHQNTHHDQASEHLNELEDMLIVFKPLSISIHTKGDPLVTQNALRPNIKATYPVEVGRWKPCAYFLLPLGEGAVCTPVSTSVGVETTPLLTLLPKGSTQKNKQHKSLSDLNSVSQFPLQQQRMWATLKETPVTL